MSERESVRFEPGEIYETLHAGWRLRVECVRRSAKGAASFRPIVTRGAWDRARSYRPDIGICPVQNVRAEVIRPGLGMSYRPEIWGTERMVEGEWHIGRTAFAVIQAIQWIRTEAIRRYRAAKDERLVSMAEQDLREAIPLGWPEHRVTPATVSAILSRLDLHLSSLEGDFEGAATLRWHLAGLREDWERGRPA